MLTDNADQDANKDARHAAIVASANRTFETLTHWLFPAAP